MTISNIKELEGTITELQQESANLKEEMSKNEEKADAKNEEHAKIFEAFPALEEKLVSLQGVVEEFKTKTTSGKAKVIFRGMDPSVSKNWKACLTPEGTEQVAKAYLQAIKGVDFEKAAFDGTYAIPVEYTNTLMGLAELNSVGLTHCNVYRHTGPGNTFKTPTKATRETVDAQSPGTANTAGGSTLGQITFTVDKYIGGYYDVLKSDIQDANMDFVNGWIIPAQAEAIGQYVDAEVFNGTNSIFTTSVVDATASVSVSGSVNIAAAVTFANLNTMYNSLSWDRGITNPMWFGSQLVYKDVMGLAGTTNDHPIFLRDLTSTPTKQIFGSPFVITPVVANAPADGAMRLCFGDPKHYTIVTMGDMEMVTNPYILMKEHKIQLIASIRSDGNITDHATAASSGAWTTMLRAD